MHYKLMYYKLMYYELMYYKLMYYKLMYYKLMYYKLMYYELMYYKLMYYELMYYKLIYYKLMYYKLISNGNKNNCINKSNEFYIFVDIGTKYLFHQHSRMIRIPAACLLLWSFECYAPINHCNHISYTTRG